MALFGLVEATGYVYWKEKLKGSGARSLHLFHSLNDIISHFCFFPGVSLRNTGDLAYVERGRIVCMGRKDNQFKVNGKRLMLEAIENQLQLLPSVSQCKYEVPLDLSLSWHALTTALPPPRVIYDKQKTHALLMAFISLTPPIECEGISETLIKLLGDSWKRDQILFF